MNVSHRALKRLLSNNEQPNHAICNMFCLLAISSPKFTAGTETKASVACEMSRSQVYGYGVTYYWVICSIVL